jgi:toxin YhaV
MVVNGWRLYLYRAFDAQLNAIEDEVEALTLRASKHDGAHPKQKLLAAIRYLMLTIIPRDPNAAEFRQGNALGAQNRHWFRAKFFQRYRLFFRFSSKEKVIVYAWMNDEGTLRKRGAKTDPYAIFQALLQAGDPPQSMQELLKRSREL